MPAEMPPSTDQWRRMRRHIGALRKAAEVRRSVGTPIYDELAAIYLPKPDLSAGDDCAVCGDLWEWADMINIDQSDGRTEWWCKSCADEETKRICG